jgi:hypothetical protein
VHGRAGNAPCSAPPNRLVAFITQSTLCSRTVAETRLITTATAGVQRVALARLCIKHLKISILYENRLHFAKISIRFNFALTGKIGWHTKLATEVRK